MKIILSNGQEIDNLTMNGSTLVSEKEVSKSLFPDTIDFITYIYDDGTEETVENMQLSALYDSGDGWYICLSQMERIDSVLTSIVGADATKQNYIAKQLSRAVQMTIEAADLDDSTAMEVADIYPAWVIGQEYKVGKIVKYGLNEDGETQLYRVVQRHVSQANWLPSEQDALYQAIGFASDGISVWTQPYGAINPETGESDAYMIGDRVHYPDKDGDIYESIIDNNIWSPEAYPQGWKKI